MNLESCPSWPKEHDWKSCNRSKPVRGFESLALRQNEKQVTRPAFCIGKNKQRDSNKEGADEVCGRKQSGGLFSPTWSRSEARRRHAVACRKNPLLSAKTKSRSQGLLFALAKQKEGFEQGGSRRSLRKKTVRWTVFADGVKEQSDAKAHGSAPKKSLALRYKPTVILIELRWTFFIPENRLK